MTNRVLAMAVTVVLATISTAVRPPGATAKALDCAGVQPAARVDGVGPPTSHADGRFTPVVLVHGFIGDPGIWSGPVVWSSFSTDRPKVNRSLLGNLQALRGADVYTVDYSSTAERWFTEPGGGGEAFLRVIDCIDGDSLRERYNGHQVVVVAHSMGGLIARWAVTDAPGAEARRARTGLVITVGTPYEGSWLGSLTRAVLDPLFPGPIRPEDSPLLEILHLVLAACANDDLKDLNACGRLRRVVDFFRTAREFAPGSAALRALSPWPSGMRVETLTSSAVARDYGGFFFIRGGRTADLGDIVVSRASATVSSYPEKVAVCEYSTATAVGAANAVLERAGMRLDTQTSRSVALAFTGACIHFHEVVLVEHTAEIIGAIREELERYTPTEPVCPSAADFARIEKQHHADMGYTLVSASVQGKIVCDGAWAIAAVNTNSGPGTDSIDTLLLHHDGRTWVYFSSGSDPADKRDQCGRYSAAVKRYLDCP